MNKITRISIGFATLLLGSCIFNEDKPDNLVNLQVDSTLFQMTRVEIRRVDASGNPLSTLLNGRVTSQSQLQGLKAPGYDGGTAYFSIRGYRGSELAYDITVTYNGAAVTDTQLNPVFTYRLINHSGTFAYATLNAFGYAWEDTLNPIDTMEVSWYIKPTSLDYQVDAEGGLYSWSDSLATPAGSSDEQKLIASSNSFILKVTNTTTFQITRVVVNQGLADSEVVLLNIPPNDGSRYNLGMFQAYGNTLIRFTASNGTSSWLKDMSTHYQTDTAYGYRWANVFLP